MNIFQKREIDEMVIVDIDASRENRLIDYHLIEDLTDDCFMPLCFGGGVKSVEDVKLLLEHGADKIIIGTHTGEKLLNEISKHLGSQSLCVSVDCSNDFVYNLSGTQKLDTPILDYAKMAQNAGAGEIMLNNIEREGTLWGYDSSLIESVCDNVDIPVIVAGGAKDYEDLYQAYQCGASGVSAGAMNQFTQQTPREAKKYIKEKGIAIR